MYLTSKSHYEASIILYRILNGDIPEHITWETQDDHIEMLKLFVVDGLNYPSISATGKFVSRRGTNMHYSTIRNIVKKYLPNIQYERTSRIYLREHDKIDLRAFEKLRATIPMTCCQICGSTENLELDHINPLRNGGTSTIDNLQWLCHVCHNKKTLQELQEAGITKPSGKNKRSYSKRLTPKSHYEASIILYRILNNDIPDHITWTIKPEHVEILKAFIIEGLNTHEISRRNLIMSKRDKPMSQDMIGIWLKRYIPNIRYREKMSGGRKLWDEDDYHEFLRLRKTLPRTPCVLCGSAEKLELDHIVTVYAGGKSEPKNLQWLCHNCHQLKTEQERNEFGWHIYW